MKRGAIDLIEKIGRIQVRPFLAPIPDAGTVVVTTVQEGVRFNYRVTREPGWWVLHCDRSAVRQVETPHSMFEVVQYLAALPRFLVIAVHRLRADTWMVVPWNASDAAQRGWPDGEPRPLHLVRDAVRPFDVLVARRLGQTMLYDTLDDGLGTSVVAEAMRNAFDTGREAVAAAGTPPEMRRAFALLNDYTGALARTEEERSRAPVERQLRWHLAFVGAELLGWNEAGEGYEVRWRYNDREHTVLLRRDFQVASAGICLDGTDLHHNLSSIVGVMDEATRRGSTIDEW